MNTVGKALGELLKSIIGALLIALALWSVGAALGLIALGFHMVSGL